MKVCPDTQECADLLEAGSTNSLAENNWMKLTVWGGFTKKNKM